MVMVVAVRRCANGGEVRGLVVRMVIVWVEAMAMEVGEGGKT